jgi:hypothetical protein
MLLPPERVPLGSAPAEVQAVSELGGSIIPAGNGRGRMVRRKRRELSAHIAPGGSVACRATMQAPP